MNLLIFGFISSLCLSVLFLLGLRHTVRCHFSGKKENLWSRLTELLFIYLFPLSGLLMFYDQTCGERPFDKDSQLTTFIVWAVVVLAYAGSRYFKQRLSPVLLVLVSVGMLVGILFTLIVCIHFSRIYIALLAPVINLIFLSPLFCFVYLLLETHTLYLYLKADGVPVNQETHVACHAIEQRLPSVALFFLTPFLLLVQAILYLLGQKPDSLISQFTNSCDFLLSSYENCSCGGDHYLCSIAANGNRDLVKPVRFGLRQNRKIVVNRQLLIANAFEHWLEEHTPRCHRLVRRIYDGMRIPVNAWSKHRRAANALYILMKPLEWMFLFWLYLTDRSPEDRIAVQYIPPALLDQFIKHNHYEKLH